MKNLILLIAIFLSAFCVAQKKVDLKTYAPQNPQPYMASAPLPHSAIGNVIAIDSYSSTGTLYNTKYYDENGVLDSLYEPSRSKSSENKYRVSKDAQGKIIEENDVDRDREPVRKTYSYDDNGNLATYTTWKYKQIKKGAYRLVEDTTTNYTYDKNGRVISAGKNNYAYKLENGELVVTASSSFGGAIVRKYNKYGEQTFYEYSSQTTKPEPQNYTYLKDKKGNPVARKAQDGNYKDVRRYHYKDGSSSENPLNNEPLEWRHETDTLIWNGYSNTIGSSQGFYKNGKLNGPGYTQGYGWRIEGEFKDGKLNGYGFKRDLSKDKTVTAGEFKYGELNGYGIKIENQEPVEAGIYKNGKLITVIEIKDANEKFKKCFGENCPDGLVERKSSSFFSKAYAIYKNGKPIGPAIELDGSKTAVIYSNGDGVIFYTGPNQNYHVIAGYKNNAMSGLGYIAQGKNYQAGIYENNKLVTPLFK